jgi:uncharacterized protein YidB (DUF937 family)
MFFDRSGGGMLAKILSGPMLGAVLGMIQSCGGLGGLLEKFKRADLADKADSWVGTGPNTPLNPDELERAIGPDELKRIADQTGMSVDDVREELAAGLPEVVNHLTPDGSLPEDDALASMIQKLSRFLPRECSAPVLHPDGS